MSVIVKTSYENTKLYREKDVYVKIGSKKHDVMFYTIIDDFNIEECLNYYDNNIAIYSYQGTLDNSLYNNVEDTDLYIVKEFNYGNDISESDVKDVLLDTPSGVVPVISLPDDFKDYEFIYNICKKYDKVRFSGGILFDDGVCRVGLISRNTLNDLGLKFKSDSYILKHGDELIDIITDENLEFIISEKKEKKAKTVKKSKVKSTSSTTNKKKQKQSLFGDLLGESVYDL